MPFALRTLIYVLACGLAALSLLGHAQEGAPADGAAAPASRAAAVQQTKCARPVYPPEGLRAKWTGVSTLAFLIGADGAVRDARILKSSGHDALDDAALAALKVCRFEPATKHGDPVESWVPVQYVWTLD